MTGTSHPAADNAMQWSLDEWQDRLSRPGRDLLELQALTENSFLFIGDQLRDFHQRTGGIEEAANAVKQALTGEGAAEGVRHMQALIERMSTFLEEIRQSSQNNASALRAICKALAGLDSPLQSFQRITRTLQIIGITTRIERSEYREENKDGTVLSEGLRHLAGMIAGNMLEIIDQVSVLRSLSETALRNESALNNEQSARARTAIDTARSVFAEQVGNRQRALQKSDDLARTSAEISRCVAEVVSSVQFHDITHQQIEHVNHALGSFCDEMIRGQKRAAADEIMALESVVAEGCRLQAEQLEHSRGELCGAMRRIIGSLHDLADAVLSLVEEARELAGSTRQDGATFFAAVEPAIASVAAILSENLSTASRSAQAVREVIDASATMVRLVDEIERFGAEMKVLALNASIESVHVRAGGSALGVIADSIQELAHEALLQTEALSAGLKQITACAESLANVGANELSIEGEKVSNLRDDSDYMLQSLRKANSEVCGQLERMNADAGKLAADISETADMVHVHDEAERILNRAATALFDVAGNFRTSSADWQRVRHIPLFQQMQQRYSMQSERAIHRQVLGETAVEEVIEKTESVGTDIGLGANVELF